MGRKQKQRGPRRKRMTRPGRLTSATATQWVGKYTGKDIVREYCKWFAVDPICAVIELRRAWGAHPRRAGRADPKISGTKEQERGGSEAPESRGPGRLSGLGRNIRLHCRVYACRLSVWRDLGGDRAGTAMALVTFPENPRQNDQKFEKLKK
uniref:Uncharacterized protein n=1 Tax=Candidatus Kentrum sp. MB TaxID=2138164 RepID=A0A450XFG7_9GAMM|nr:MAG: hypothetical protein BECKMB1821G_GA0114241_103216 [Candidatus Kentron sp. MB]VFK29338.1 MAG: hypothetical protein BECKMB1821I_GA0114274_100940 [Candidatus Kentron sp. MB]VFK74755.1 MAG: hypothetical protein BECKMB1821H_GA0114242_100940 [Candidatus Kentron sp. MB]